MKKYILLIILFYQLLFTVYNQSNIIDIEELEEKYKKEYITKFKKNVKDYLTKKKLYKNDNKSITKDVFKKIFKEIMMNGMDIAYGGFADIYDKVADEFSKDAFPKGVNTIKGSEIEKYFDYDKIMEKFNKYANTNRFNKEDL